MTLGGPEADSPRRRLRETGVVVAIAALAISGAAALRFIWLPEYRPGLRSGERYGIDVSSHQGDIDWDQVAADDVDFAYIKASEGGDFTDDRFAANWQGAASAGLEWGPYHFFTLCTSGDIQARHFLSLMPPDADALPPAVDLEIAGNCGHRPDNDEVRRELEEFLQLVEGATGQQALLYVGDDFERRYPVREPLDRPLWHARFLRRPNVEAWAVWQVMGFAHIDGIDGDVDLDVMRLDLARRR